MANENDIHDALVSEVAERIAKVLAQACAESKPTSDEDTYRIGQLVNVRITVNIPALVPDIAAILADFKRAIELNARGEVAVAEPELTKLIEEARKWTTFFACVENRPSLAGCFNGLRTALERQTAARRAAEDKALPGDCAPVLKSGIEALDIYTNQLRAQIETARTALRKAVWLMPNEVRWRIEDGQPLGPDYDTEVERSVALIRAQLDSPTESGEPVHDWTWALGQMKKGKRVQRPKWGGSFIHIVHDIVSDGSPVNPLLLRSFTVRISDCDALDWQLVEDAQSNSAKSEVSDEAE